MNSIQLEAQSRQWPSLEQGGSNRLTELLV